MVRPFRRRGEPRLDARAARRAAPFATGGVYLNFTGEEQQDRVLAAYGVEAYARLRALKDRYDPSNVLRLNHNVSPSGRLARAGTTIRGGNDGRHREVTG